MTLIAVSCSISKGAFSGERVFEIQTVAGEPYLGVASPIYCWDPAGKPLPPLENGGSIPGKVAARLLVREEKKARIVVPGNDVIDVDPDIMSERPSTR